MSDREKQFLAISAQEFFFRAMLVGYAGGKEPETVPGFAGSKLITYTEGNFELRDLWFSHRDSNKSAGATMIWHKGDLIWHMSYEGWYTSRALPLLKHALLENYERSIFRGGRGPESWQNGPLLYMNSNLHEGDFLQFAQFSGVEHIFDDEGRRCLGTLSYRGGMMI